MGVSRLVVVGLLLFDVIPPSLADNDYDFIVVGAGASGSAVASRLSESGEYTVLLLEAGGPPPYFSSIPYLAPGPHAGEYDWNFLTEKQEFGSQGFKDQRWVWPRGKALGGSTAINSLAYNRGNRRDYDLWEKMGNRGWAYDDVLEYFIKLEDYQAPIYNEEDEAYHGRGGPVTISVPPFRTPIADAFLEAGREIGYEIVDVNARNQTGFSSPVHTVKNGTRWSTYNAYLEPALDRRNLCIETNAFVTKIVFDYNKHAVGVVYHKDNDRRHDLRANANKEVVVSAGTVSSPPLLMLSGVGPRETLDKFQIPVVVDSPGVGQNLVDHVSVTGVTFTVESDVGFKTNTGDVTPENLEMWERKRLGPLTVAAKGEGISFMNSKYADPTGDYPDFELQFFHGASSPLRLDKNVYKAAFGPKVGSTSMLLIHPVVLRPRSVGYLTLNSSDPYDHPILQPRTLSDPYDAKVLIESVKASISLTKTAAFSKYGVKWHGRKYPGCEDLTELSDEYLECHVRRYSFGFYHQSGTCKMGPKEDETAVVDDRLRVRGVTGLRVVDMSIAPTIVSAHTMGPAIMIGEKGADMILQDWSPPPRRQQ